MTSAPRTVLYVQHAAALGGSAMSLLYTIQGLDPARFTPVVALVRPADELARLYEGAGIRTVPWRGIHPWDHSTVAPQPLHRPSTWAHLADVARHWRSSQRSTLELVRHVGADLVHLNSMPLSPCAEALVREGIPTVWHVREPPLPARGPRYRAIRARMMAVDELVFISHADRRAWVGGERGLVIPNFVDFSRFDRWMDGGAVRARLGIAPDAPVLLYVGGWSPVKGIFPLLGAVARLRERFPGLRCLMPGSVYAQSTRLPARAARAVLPLVGAGTVSQRVRGEIERLGLADALVQLPFADDVAPLFAASDVVVFPATRPHFARPAVEASAMARPTVASRLAGLDELVDDSETGLLVPPGDPAALADALARILGDDDLRRRMGEAAYRAARARYSAGPAVERVMEVYDRVLAAHGR
ncbi:glycosyltransferase family 4 protein [Longimicrobium sp.]|uniref:glycosyltransferase family 4 protein n=1 Tax=Longimicrobium sp. TaxID=2029185 RepID=UPI002E33690A|nr:glycosyltransferase family 4 protein [Longimicrobium sp.]HEX6041333.1 glycosyltransferase family 4 protein [Longimicrobium sp.]